MKLAKMNTSEKITEMQNRIELKKASIAAFKKLGYSDLDLKGDYENLELLHKKLLRYTENA